MKDPSYKEYAFAKDNTFRGRLKDESIETFCGLSLHIVLLLGFPMIVTGVWAMVYCMVFIPITTQAIISVIIISLLMIIVGVLMIAVGIGFVTAVKCEKASTSKLQYRSLLLTPGIIIAILAVISIILGISAGAQIHSVSEAIQTSANTSLHTIHVSPKVMNTWNDLQRRLKCCGVVKFKDYRNIFNNASVPVSCCKVTSPSVNHSTCKDIVMNTKSINISKFIYTEGCAPKLEEYFSYILSVIGGVNVIVGLIQIIGEIMSLFCFVCKLWSKHNGHKLWQEGLFERTYKYFILVIGLMMAMSIGCIVVAIWALAQDLLNEHRFIAVGANAVVISLSLTLLFIGIIMICVSICQLGMTALKPGYVFIRFFVEAGCVSLCILPMIIIVILVGIVAASMNRPTAIELHSNLDKYLEDQSVQQTWNAIQKNMKCCGVVDSTDYETVFNNLSVPVSCCNPQANKCPETGFQQTINQTDLILYSEGCVSHLKSFFGNIFNVISGVSITIGVIQFVAVFFCLSLFCWIFCVSNHSVDQDNPNHPIISHSEPDHDKFTTQWSGAV